MPDASDITRLEQITEVLDRHRVAYIVIGGQAEYLMGSPRVTFDVDVCYSRDVVNHEPLASALRELKVSLRNAPADLPFRIDAETIKRGSNFTFDTPFGPFDLLGYVEPIGEYPQLEASAQTYRVGGREFRVIDLDDLIRIKRHINRSKDRDSLYQLLAIKRIREEGGGDDPRRLDA